MIKNTKRAILMIMQTCLPKIWALQKYSEIHENFENLEIIDMPKIKGNLEMEQWHL